MTTASASAPIIYKGFLNVYKSNITKQEMQKVKGILSGCAQNYFNGSIPIHACEEDQNVNVFKIDDTGLVCVDTDDKHSNDYIMALMEKYGVNTSKLQCKSVSNHFVAGEFIHRNHYWFTTDFFVDKKIGVNGTKLDILTKEIVFEPIVPEGQEAYRFAIPLTKELYADIMSIGIGTSRPTRTKKNQTPVINEVVHIDDNDCPEDIKEYIDQTFSVEDSTAQDTFFYNGASLLRKYGDEQGGDGYKAVHYFAKMAGKNVYNEDKVNVWLHGTKVDRMSPTYGILKLKGGECLLDVEKVLSAASTAVNSVVNSDEEVESGAVVVKEEIIASSEEDVAVNAYKILKSLFMYINKQYYGKWGNIWCNDNTQWEALLCNAIVNLKIIKREIKEHKFGTQNIDVVWCDTYTHLMAVYKRVRHMIVSNPRDDMYDLFHSSTLGKLCFEDGVYNFTTKKFLKWESKEFKQNPVYSCVKIHRKFPSYEDEVNDWAEDIKKARLVFHAAMGEEQAEKFLAYLARVTAGKIEDKVFSCCMFNRDCSKGVINDWFIAAFGNYVGQADSNAVVLKESFGDSEKENGWLIPLQYCRHVFISELEVDPNNSRRKINSKLIKSMCSGGDPMKARLMRENGVSFRLQCGINIMANDLMPFSSPDVLEKCLMLKSVIQFKTQAYIDAELLKSIDCPILHDSLKQRLKVSDPSIRNKVKTEEWADALVRIMIHYYTDKAVVINVEKQEDDECESLDTKVVERFKFTGVETDRVTNESLRAFASMNNTSLKKMKNTIAGIDERIKDFKSGSVKGMSGILEIIPA